MEYLFILALIAVVIILLARGSGKNNGTTLAAIDAIIREVKELRKEIRQLKSDIHDSTDDLKNKIDNIQPTQNYQQQQSPKYPPPLADTIPHQDEPIVVGYPAKEPVIQPITEQTANEEGYPTLSTDPGPAIAAYSEQETISDPVLSISELPQNVKEPVWEDKESTVSKWMANNPDLEKFIGENLINKIGIAVLVLGIAFFVKYAIDKDWINEIGRVCIGLGCGALLVGLAHFMRNSYRSFSSVLAGGGIAVFYFTIAFAFHQYHLMPQTAAFIIMVVITAFAITLSLLYDKLELAIIAVVGGFLAPFMVSTGEGNYTVLFTYLIILNIGVLSLAYFKRWTPINIIALFFTEIIYGGWLATVLNNPSKPISYPTALLFASAFYLIFLGMNMVHQMKNNTRFKPFDFFILLFISSTYFGAGIILLHAWNGGVYQGLFTLGLGIVNLGMAWYVFKQGKTDKNLFFLLIGITLTFITLTIPLQLHGHAITLFWSAEFVLLYWLSIFSGIRIFKYSSAIICVLTLVSLAMDWEKAGNISSSHLHVIYSNVQGIVTNIVAIAAFGAWYFLLRKDKDGDIAGVSNSIVSKLALTMTIALLFITCIFGVNLYFHEQTSYVIPNVYHKLITDVFALVFVIIAQKKKDIFTPWLHCALLVVCFLVLVSNSGSIAELQSNTLSGRSEWIHFYFHWIDSVLLGVLFYKTIQGIRSEPEVFQESIKAVSVIMTIMILTFLSVELLHIYVIAGHGNYTTEQLEQQYSKAGLTVIWALCSFSLMWLGMKHSQKILRIISLVLFSIVLLKLFVLDISGISEGGKILAFILLGVLLLTVSFMYQKLKKIIIDDKKE